MAGHNKWSKIKHKKSVQDARRSKIFSKIIKDITVAVKEGGSPDPAFNPRLRMAIANARGVNMPKENIERAIKKASDPSSQAYIETTYEGYAPGGVAIFIECTTDNLNRTVSNIRAIFNKRGGSLAKSGSVEFLFERKGIFVLPLEGQDVEELELELIDAGAEDIEVEDNEMTVTVDFADFGKMQQKLEELGLQPKSAKIERIPINTTKLPVDQALKALQLIEALEDDDDVQAVYHNLELTDELMAKLN